MLLAPGCDNDREDGGSALRISFSFTPPAGGASDIVWLAEGGGQGDIHLVDLMARDLTQRFDGFDIEIQFDPLVVEARDLSSEQILTDCTGLPALGADNVANGNANSTGTILFSEALVSPSPGCPALPGATTLARITFRARGLGSSTLTFEPSGSHFVRSDPNVSEVPVEFFDSGATLEVTQ